LAASCLYISSSADCAVDAPLILLCALLLQLQAGKGTTIVFDQPQEEGGKKKSACCSS
jgi:hypothetical protein